MDNCSGKTLVYFFMFVMVFVTSIKVNATQMNLSLGVDAEYSDNSTLSNTDIYDDLRLSTLLGISLLEESARLNTEISALFEHENYRDNTFVDENWFNLSLNTRWGLFLPSFYWVLEDYYSQQELNPSGLPLPNNLINTNAFSTGPDLYFRINNMNQLYIGLRRNAYRFEDADFDSDRSLINLSWQLSLSNSIELSLNTAFQKADFLKLNVADFDRKDIFASINSRHSRHELQFDIGATYIERDVYEDVDGFMSRITWTNQFRRQSYFQLEFSSQLMDSGMDLLVEGSREGEFDRAGTLVTGDIFYDHRLYSLYHIASGSNSYSIQAEFRDEDYEESALSRQSHGMRVQYDNVYSSVTNINSSLSYQRYKSADQNQIDTERLFTMGISHRLGRNATLRFEYLLNTQNSSNPILEYIENQVLVRWFYGDDPQSYR